MADYTLQRTHVQAESNSPALARAEFKANIEAIDKISDIGTASSVVKSDANADVKIGRDVNVARNVNTVTVNATGDVNAVTVNAANVNATGNVAGVDVNASQDVNATRNVNAVDVNATGDVSGINGTFTGDVDGVNGVFTGDVDGVNGTFTGSIESTGTGTFNGGLIGQAKEVSVATSLTLTELNCKSTILNNYGQTAQDVEIQLPNASAGLNMVTIIGTSQLGNTFKLKAGLNDKIFLDGIAGVDNQSISISPEAGNFIALFTFKTGDTSWDWMAITGYGTWVAVV